MTCTDYKSGLDIQAWSCFVWKVGGNVVSVFVIWFLCWNEDWLICGGSWPIWPNSWEEHLTLLAYAGNQYKSFSRALNTIFICFSLPFLLIRPNVLCTLICLLLRGNSRPGPISSQETWFWKEILYPIGSYP